MQLIENMDLSSNNTLGLPAFARFGATIAHADDIPALITITKDKDLKVRILGRGSNCLIQPEVDAVVGVMAIKGRDVQADGPSTRLVTAQAGEDWPELVEWTVAEGLTGLENLAGIPGTVGAAPVQNIGAYGLELADRLHALTAYDTIEGQFRTFTPEECDFAYRTSLFKQNPGRFIIAEVTLALSTDWQPVLDYPGLADDASLDTAAAVMNRVLAVRQSKLPDWRTLGNAGSFFHNPIVSIDIANRIEGAPVHPLGDNQAKLSAAWLIEQCGFKGCRRGAAGVYDKHALIIVNHGGATYDDIAGLAAEISAAVKDRFGITLAQEPIGI